MANKLLIPSAKLVAAEMQLDFGLIPPVLLPLGTSAALDYILDSQKYDTCYIGVNEESSRVYDYVTYKNLECEIFSFSEGERIGGQLGDTVNSMLNNCSLKPGDSVSINFGDTIVLNNKDNSYLDQAEDIVFISSREETFRWTTLTTDINGLSFQDKNRVDKPEEGDVVVGLFYIKDALLFSKILSSLMEDSINIAFGENDVFYMALEQYLNLRARFKLIQAVDWIDLGHLDTYYQSKAKFLNARHFNSFEIDLFWGKIKKKSVYKKKFIDEINWYVNLPNALRSLIPNVYDYSIEEPVFVEMEYYGYPTLNQIYLFSNISISQWNNIFIKLLSIQSQFQSYTSKIDSSYFKSFYLDKTKQRLNDLRENPEFIPFFENDITINGKVYPSLDKTIESLDAFIDSKICNTEIPGGIIHGDFCLSNLLYDTKTGIIKLIDPRGSFIDNDLFGDPRYDLAKILHSVHGYYDLILAGSYQLSKRGSEFDFSVIFSAEQEKLSNLFLDLMAKKGINLEQVLAIESTLFLSMVPLHADDVNRQKAFLFRGIELYYALKD